MEDAPHTECFAKRKAGSLQYRTIPCLWEPFCQPSTHSTCCMSSAASCCKADGNPQSTGHFQGSNKVQWGPDGVLGPGGPRCARRPWPAATVLQMPLPEPPVLSYTRPKGQQERWCNRPAKALHAQLSESRSNLAGLAILAGITVNSAVTRNFQLPHPAVSRHLAH